MKLPNESYLTNDLILHQCERENIYNIFKYNKFPLLYNLFLIDCKENMINNDDKILKLLLPNSFVYTNDTNLICKDEMKIYTTINKKVINVLPLEEHTIERIKKLYNLKF